VFDYIIGLYIYIRALRC